MFKTSCLNILIANLKSGGSFKISEVIKELKDYLNIKQQMNEYFIKLYHILVTALHKLYQQFGFKI